MRIRFVLALAVFVFALLVRGGGAGEESFTLDNGLTVIFSEMPGAGAVSGYLAFSVGSGDETDAAEHGTAHLLEHLLFRNRSRSGGELIPAVVQENGGYANAFTGREMTAYTLSLPAGAALLLPSLLVDLTHNAQFEPGQLAEEQEIVVEEINGGRDNPDSLFGEFTDARYYGANHPYGRSIAASPESVRGATSDSVRDFHSRFYRPDNAAMVLAGEFDPDEMKRAAAEAARGWLRPEAPLPGKALPPVPARAEPVVAVTVDERAALAKAYINFPSFPGNDDKALAADILASLLSGGEASRLDAGVWRDLQLVNGIAAFTPATALDGRLTIMLATQPAKLEQAVAAVFRALEELFASPPDEREIERAGALLKKYAFRSRDDSRGVALSLVTSVLTEGDWRRAGTFGSRVDAVGTAEVMAAARAILSRPPLVTVMLPEGDDKAVAGTERRLDAVARAFAVPAGEEQAAAAPAFVELEPVGGVRLAVMRDPGRNLVSAVAVARGGLLAETSDNNGIGRLMAAAWTKGTLDKPSRVLARELEQLGATVDAGSDAMTVSLSGEFLRDNWRESLGLFAEILACPAFDAADVEEARRDLLAAISQRGQNLGDRAMQLADEAQYAGHPFSLETEGREDAVKTLSPGDAAGWYERLVRDGEVIVAIAGDMDPAEARAVLEESLAGWKKGRADAAIAVPPAPPVPDEPVVTAKESNRTQTHLVMAFPAPDMYSPDREAMKVLEVGLNGLGGTLMTELREKRRLAYTTYADYSPALGVGGFRLYISCESSKTDAALEGMRDVLRDLLENGPPDKTVDTARRVAAGQYRIFSQTLRQKTAQAVVNLLNGRDVDYQERYLARIAAVTPGDVRRVLARYLSPEHAVIAILGPAGGSL